MKSADTVAGCPAVNFNCGVWFSGIHRKNSRDESLIIITYSFAKNRKPGTVGILCYGQDDLTTFFIYVFDTENTDL